MLAKWMLAVSLTLVWIVPVCAQNNNQTDNVYKTQFAQLESMTTDMVKRGQEPMSDKENAALDQALVELIKSVQSCALNSAKFDADLYSKTFSHDKRLALVTLGCDQLNNALMCLQYYLETQDTVFLKYCKSNLSFVRDIQSSIDVLSNVPQAPQRHVMNSSSRSIYPKLKADLNDPAS